MRGRGIIHNNVAKTRKYSTFAFLQLFMAANKQFDVIIIGGSYAGLSAALALGRSLRQVLIIDSGLPCNRQTPHSHNFLTQDGQTPAAIAALARQQVQQYATVQFHDGVATEGLKTTHDFEIRTQAGDSFTAKKLIFATGLKDQFPDIGGMAACWGISVIHCPYCHGYEVKHEKTAILSRGQDAFEFSQLITNWTKDITLLTNGPSDLSPEQTAVLQKLGVTIMEKAIDLLDQTNGQINHVRFKDGSVLEVKALYAKIPFTQQCDIPVALGCELTEQGLIKTTTMQKTTVPGVYACGDNSSMRSLPTAVYTGSMAGVMVNKELVEDKVMAING
jgi:thioredoxin reductase